MNRRTLLKGMAASAAVIGCGGEGADGDCAETDAQIEGPYFLDLEADRIDITEGKAGIGLTLHLQVVDVADCTPIADAVVDVWHADADGVYSGFSEMETEGETFLRGTQVTDAAGECQIETIFPGFYTGRTSHIHVRVQADGYPELITQLYFPRHAILSVAPEYPGIEEYTTNTEDGWYDEANEMAVTGNVDAGFAASHAIGLRA